MTGRIAKGLDLEEVKRYLDDTFRGNDLESDPAFSRFLPMVYDPIAFPWREAFEPEFVRRCNGLMMRGQNHVGKIWCIAFPADEVLDSIVSRARPGDLIFSHHPINMECGDPRGARGRGFLPLPGAQIDAIRAKGLSFYSCHAPLDIHPVLSTSDAIVRAIGGQVSGQFLPIAGGYAGRLCEIPPIKLDALSEVCRQSVPLPYVDLQCQDPRLAARKVIRHVAVIAGGGGDVAFFREADKLGADSLIASEVTSKIDNELGRRRQAEIESYLPTTSLIATGLSHAGSEFLVMQELAPFFAQHLGVTAEAVPESHWWR